MENQPRYRATEAVGLAIADLGLRQDWIAAKAKVSPSFLNRIIKGTRMTDADTAEKIAAIVRVPFFLAFEIPISNTLEPIGKVA